MLTSTQNMNETPDIEKEGTQNYQLVTTILFYFISSFTQQTLFQQLFKPAHIYSCSAPANLSNIKVSRFHQPHHFVTVPG